MNKKEYVPYFKRNKIQNQTTSHNNRREWDDDYDTNQRTSYENSTSNVDFNGKSVSNQVKDMTVFPNKSNEKSNLIETKLIDELTKPTGISFQPSDTQLNELVKRAKGLNMEYLYEILHSKIYSYENYDNQNLVKSFIKSLYCIYVLMKEYPLFKDLMTESLSLIYSIKDYFSISNKKVYEITVLIIKLVIGDSNEESINDYDNTCNTTYPTQSEMKQEENQGKDVDLFENEENSTEKTSKLKFIKSKHKSSKVINTLENIFESTEDRKQVESSHNSIFDSIPKEIDFTNTVNVENIFENKEKLEKERKLNDLLNSISEIDSSNQTKDNQSLEVSLFNSLNINHSDDKKNNPSASNISMSNLNDRLFLESHPLIKEQIDSQFKYLLSTYGESNKENLYDYAKQIVLNNPLLKGLLNKEQEKERIIICKEDKSFNSKFAFGEKEEKDSFDFVNDLLKK